MLCTVSCSLAGGCSAEIKREKEKFSMNYAFQSRCLKLGGRGTRKEESQIHNNFPPFNFATTNRYGLRELWEKFATLKWKLSFANGVVNEILKKTQRV